MVGLWASAGVRGSGHNVDQAGTVVPRTGALVLLACGGLTRRSEQIGALVLGVMMLGSVLPAGTFVVVLRRRTVWLGSSP